MQQTLGFELAGDVGFSALNCFPSELPPDRKRHSYGDGPFARLRMPPLPVLPGLYLWEVGDQVVYIGQTRTPLKTRLGPNGYSSISNYNTFARQPGRKNGGQQTNCRINALANEVLVDGGTIRIWYKITSAEDAPHAEAEWMRQFGVPAWNHRDER